MLCCNNKNMEQLFYHTCNRGVEKRKIFLEKRDYARAVHDIYEFNDINLVINVNRRFGNANNDGCDGCSTSIIKPIINKPRERLVDLMAWSLMPNHYHVFSSPIVDNGLIKFHKKFGGGFTNFFNIKYKRSGALFQGRYKRVQVTDDRQAIQLICYIHSNSLDLWKPNWKEKGLTSLEIQNALRFLEKYRWSSHMDWWGIKNFPSLINANSMTRFFKNSEEYREFFIDWLKYYEKNSQNLTRSFLLE